MTTCSRSADLASPLPFEQRLGDQIATSLLAEGWADKDVLRLDGDLYALFLRLGAEVAQRLLQAAVDRVVAAARETGLGVHRSPVIEVLSVFGPVSLVSPYLRDEATHRNLRPAAVQLGLVDGWRSPSFEKTLASFGAECAFARAADLYQEHYGWHPETARTRRVTESMAEETQLYVEKRLATPRPLPETEQAKQMLVESDGCLLRTGEYRKGPPVHLTPVRDLPV
jgi:hypothetical protein